ncbi:MAG: hypothetical protein U1E87_00410 [Alphaproteobacteria bacterium]
MPAYSVIAALAFAFALAGFKLFAVPAHLPPTVAPADIVAQNKALAETIRVSSVPAQIWVAAAAVDLQSDGPRTIDGARLLTMR